VAANVEVKANATLAYLQQAVDEYKTKEKGAEDMWMTFASAM
jgi:hypothetical protein